MTHDRGGDSEGNRAELEPALRARVVGLDEPVSRIDWQDVRTRAGRSRTHLIAVAVGALLLAAAAATGAAVSPLSPFRASGRIVAVARTPTIAPGAIRSQMRLVASTDASGGAHRLYVAPGKDGGFCYEWTGTGSGCDKPSLAPFLLSWRQRQVMGAVSSRQISAVRIKFTDGTTARPAVAWVAAPIDAGFFLYAIPAGKTVAEINMG